MPAGGARSKIGVSVARRIVPWNAAGDVREEVGDVLTALAVLFELPLRPDDAAFVLVPAAAEGFDGDRLAVERVELRFVVEGIDVAGPAVAEDEDDRLGLGREVRLLWGERVDERGGGRGDRAV